jgi:serine/threonine protein kinase
MAKNTYVLGRRIARGGMAEIYLGIAVGEAAFQKIVAVKRILPHYAQDREFIEMFRDEAHICKRLQHNNIVQVYDFTEVDGSYALIMEHVDGADLRSLLSACETAKTRLSLPMALHIAACAARALHYAHTKADEITSEPLGIVHRDISPQNILISYEGDVKITDFGIASAENKLTETKPGVVKGKYSYMSPEQVLAKPLDGRSDVFSLAVVLWETLAMKRLFAGMSEVESIRKVQNCEIPYDICELNPEVDKELRAIVMKGLAKDRKERYQTAAAFEKDLSRYLHSRYSEFTSRELGNFLKRILAKRRDKTQEDIRETLAQASKPQAVAPAVNMAVGQTAGAMPPVTAEASRLVNNEIPMNDASRLGSHHAQTPLMDDRTITLSGGFKKNHPSRIMVVDQGYPQAEGTATRQRPRNHMAPPPRRATRSKLPMILLLLGMLVGVLYFNRDELVIDKKLQIDLRTSPEVVTLKVNGVKIYDGAYVKSPVKLRLAPGAYEMEIGRPGYQREMIRFQGDAGEVLKPEKIFLKKLPHAQLYPVRLLSSGTKVFVDIDNGLFEGETPLLVELTPGMSHFVTFRAVDESAQYKCEFRVDRPPQGGVPSTLLITPAASGQRARCQIKN